MKHLIHTLMAAAMLTLVSCARTVEEDTPFNEDSASTLKITARIDNQGTRTAFNEEDGKSYMTWLQGDRIALVAGNKYGGPPCAFFCDADSDGEESTFTLQGSIDSENYDLSGLAVYPGDLTIGGSYGAYTVTLPAAYSVSGSDLSRVKVPMIGSTSPSNPDNYTFQVALGVLKVTLTNVPVNARKLVLKGVDGDKLSGTFPLDFNYENGFRMSEAGNAGNSVTVNFTQQAPGATVAVYVPVPIGTISAGAKFEVQDENGTVIKETPATTRAITVRKGHLTPLTSFAVEDWVTLGTGLFMDDDAFYASGYYGRTAEDYIPVTIQQHATETDRYRVVNPYQAYLDRRGMSKMDGATGPNEYLTFTLLDGWVINDSYRTGLEYYDDGDELVFDHPYWAGVENIWNNRVIKWDGDNPANIQLAPVYFYNSTWTIANNAAENPKIEIVFPGSTPMLPNNNYPTHTYSQYQGYGLLYTSISDNTISAVKVKAASSLDAGVAALENGDADLVFTSEEEIKLLDIPDGKFRLVYKVETDGHGYTYKDGGYIYKNSKPQVELTSGMVKASATSTVEGTSIDYAIDGDADTYWHSPYGDDSAAMPWNDPDYGIFIDIDLGEKALGDFAMRFRLRNVLNNHPNRIALYGTNDKSDWGEPLSVSTHISDSESGISSGAWTNPIFANAATPVRFIRVSIVEDSNGYDLTDYGCTHMAELELFGDLVDAGSSQDPLLSIFTDLSFSALKYGVTQADINVLKGGDPDIATLVAEPLLNGTYSANEKDFRIHSYEPYSDNHIFMALSTYMYSSMDNPTGIQVANGDDIIVCVDQIPAGQSVKLAVYGEEDEYGPNFGGATWDENCETHVLAAGINRISILSDGLLYVLNTITQSNPSSPDTTPVDNFSPVKVHILPGYGTVQGYFDPARHSNARGQEILDNYTYKYFMVKGEKCSFLFHTDYLKNYAIAEIRSGNNVWDEAIGWQHELMGLDKKHWFNNHILAVTSTRDGIYMNAYYRRLQFHADAMSMFISQDALIENEGGWGPFHEMGHINQPAINWNSTYESSNNLFSNFCKKKLADKAGITFESRGSSIRSLANSYAEGKPWVRIGTGTTIGYNDQNAEVEQGEDSGLHLRMNWQLWNYYHNCGHNTEFWPTLFEYLRQNPLNNDFASYYRGLEMNVGLAQLQFYKACCIAAQEDLTEFFDAWGFFRPISIPDYYQYGTASYIVTQSMIDAFKTEVAEMNLKKAAPIQYLEDRTTGKDEDDNDYTYSEMGYYTLFVGDSAPVVTNPVAVIMGTAADVYNVENAVAVELREGNTSSGALLYFSNIRYFELPEGLTFTSNSLWAVQSDGTRIKVGIL